jgi:hypothetical protein
MEPFGDVPTGSQGAAPGVRIRRSSLVSGRNSGRVDAATITVRFVQPPRSDADVGRRSADATWGHRNEFLSS